MNKKFIGIFDSGIGGLTVLAQVQKLLPNESLIYLGDTARVPYGTKSKETIERFASEDVQFLLNHSVKFIIAACNTVSALALSYLKTFLTIPILGVIEPAVSKALECSTHGRIGVIGTRATVESNAYEKTFQQFKSNARVWSVACPLFVPMVEENWMEEPETSSIAEKYLRTLIHQQIDTLILGCTHYPLLKNVIQKIVGSHVTIIDSAISTAVFSKNILEKNGLLQPQSAPECLFFVTDEAERFQRMGEKFLGQSISKVERIILEKEIHHP